MLERPTTVLAALHAVSKHYGGQDVLVNATLELRAASRTALIGRNGAGKSTILRLLAGAEEPDGGQVYVRPGVETGVLEQDLTIDGDLTVLEVSDLAFARLDELEARLARLELAGLDEPERYAEWEELHERFERRGGYARRALRDAVLDALGFRGREEQRARHLSGGEKTRLGLARLLMTQPDLLLLDEPTNHLDLEMRGWLEGHLARYPGAALIVSHDRAFLEGACQATAEVSLGTLRAMDVPPDAYRAARAEQERIEAATRANQQRELDRIEAAAAQMKKWAGQNAKLHRRARSIERRAERHAEAMLPDADPKERTTRFTFESEPSGEIALQTEHLTKSFGRRLFEDVNVTVRLGDRIALLGPNGAGKTTFLRVLLGDQASDDPRGHARFGARVRVGYYDQELRDVDPSRTLFEELVRLVGDVEAHNLLGRFLFPYDAQFKLIGDLSGGERARLALLKLTLGRYNFLVLDEPTNHLDVEMIEALEAALAQYEGTLLLVSHDRRFVRAVTDTVWELRDGRFTAYEGDLDYYLRRRAAERGPSDADPAASVVRDGRGAARTERGSDAYGSEYGGDASRSEQRGRPGGTTGSAGRRHAQSGTPRGKGAQAEAAGGQPARAAAPGAKRPSRWQLERRQEELERQIHELEEQLAVTIEALARPQDLTPEEIESHGRAHADLEARLLTAMADWEETTSLLSD